MSATTTEFASSSTFAPVHDEMEHYEQQIKKYRLGSIGETKMQKLRLQYGTYAQRQDGVQMQRIKIPGGLFDCRSVDALSRCR